LHTVRSLIGALLVCVAGAGPAAAQPGSPFGTAQLQISGARLTLYSDALTTDVEQTINVGEAARVRTCYGTGAACGTAAPGSVPGLKVVGDLSGPELPQAIPYETAPGGTFFLPGFQREGDYLLSNIRLVDVATGRALANAEPSLATLHVRQILLASATVTRLTLADLQARGITITQQDFNAFKFAVGFVFSGTTVTIELPVLYNGNGLAQLLAGPVIKLDGLPPAIAGAVKRWQPPNIIPFQLNATGPRVPNPGGTDDEITDPEYPLYGAIILPGSVSFLNQFFDAKLIVASGAPNGSGVTLQNVTGAMRLPSGDVLRLASTAPPVAVGQKLPVLEANGQGAIGPGEQGTASWTIEGLLPGTHVLRMEIEADLMRPGRPDLATGGVVQAAVEVVDARFQLAFNHPDTVRTGEPYSVYVTVTNLSRATQNLVTLELASENITGAHKADAQESFAKTIPTLEPGASETLEYKLIADVTGTCVATTFQATGGLSGVIHLRAGVGEAGIPLSPAALVLPRFTNLLPKSLVDGDVRLLGLAYSLATAPAGAAPAGLPHPLKSDVERRAIDLGEAGQRLYLQDQLLETLEALALDQLGNRQDLSEYDSLRRALDRGAQASTALGDLFRQEQLNRNLTADAFVDHFAATVGYGRPWMAAALIPNGSQPPPVLEVRQFAAAGTTYLAYTSEDAARIRSLPYGEIYALHDAPAGTKMPFALVGLLDSAASYRVDLHAPATAASGRLVLVVPSDDLTGFRKVDFGFVTMNANEVWEIRAVKSAGDAPLTFALVYAGSGMPVPGAPAPSITNLSLPPFRVIGAVQDPELDRYGLGISYLFNRPPDKSSAETPSSYAVRSTFHGQDTSSPAVTADRVATKAGAAAYWQPNSERVVDVRYDSPISALNGLFEGVPVIRHEQLLVTSAIRDAHGTPLDPQVPAIVVDPNRTGGLVEGKVLRGDSTPAAGSLVQILRFRKVTNPDSPDGEFLYLDIVAEAVTGADGAFYFDFVEEPPPPGHTIGHPPAMLSESVQSGFILRATVPAGADPVLQPEEKEEVSTKIRLQNRLLHVNIALLGRGTVKGRLVHSDDGSPVTDGTVSAASTLFPEQRTLQPAADGSFTFGGLPIGPITLSGRDLVGNRVYQTVGIQKPGDVVSVTLQLGRTGPPKTGTVSAKVLRLRSGSPRPPPVPSPGATVAVYTNGNFIASKASDSLGNATFTGVPVGKVTVQAADFAVSRTPALTDLTLAADATVTATLTLADAAPRSVVGRVLFHDGPTNTNLPVSAAVAFIAGPGVFAYTDATGTYRIDGVPAQGVGDAAYTVTAFDNVRGLQGQTALPPVLDSGDGSPLLAADILLVSMSGGIDGVVLDPLGRPYGGAAVELGTDISTFSGGGGRFSFDDISVGSWNVVAHVGDGLVSGKVGYFGQSIANIVFGGHRPFVTIQMAGSGVVNVRTRTSASQGVLSPVNYRPTAYANAAIGPLGGDPIQTSTDPDGRLTLVLPVGHFSLTAVNPLNGNKSFSQSIDYPGQVINLDIVFDTASTVTGHVVGVDGITPVPNADVSFSASGLLPQTQRTDGQGAFRYELVPQGHVSVTAAALVGSVDRVGRADGYVTGPGQTLDLTVVMEAQGTVRGQIVDLVGSLAAPLAFAQYYVQESGYPNRRLPAGTGFYSADAQGQYEVSHVFVGLVTVVARDRNQVERQGSARGEITTDFQVLTMPDVVMSTSVGSLGVTVRDPDSGGPVADAVLTLSNGDVAVADANGQASFDALPLGTYSVHAFHAPTGRAGLTSGLTLQNAGDRVDAVVVLDTRGQVGGTLWDDAAKTTAVGGGTVQLSGRTNGRTWGTSIRALATTSSDVGSLGRFLFDGIPPGSYDLAAATSTSPRRAAASLTTTPTAPVVSIDLVLEPVADRFVRLFESLTAGISEVNPANGVYSVTVTQPRSCGPPCAYAFTTATPSSPYPGHLFRFPAVLTSQSLDVTAQESSGKQRTGKISGTGAFAGSGAASDPYRLVLRAKGRVVVTVRDSLNQPAQADVTLNSWNGRFEAATDASGQATFDGILSGDVYAAARVVVTGFGGTASGTLQFDDQTLNLGITLAPAVLAHGVVYHPPPGDIWNGDVATLTPESGAIVQIRDSLGTLQIVTTGSDGTYHFAGLRTGAYTISATDALVVALASGGGTLVGPNGNDNGLPPLVLDASRPTIVSIVPPPGSVGISRNAPVEITFSEPLLDAVLPSGGPTSPYFTLRSATGLQPAGAWTASLNASGQQIVRFTPAGLYDNSTVHSLTISGGPSGVRDRAGRPVTDSGNVGSNFTTSDTVGPLVTGYVPSLDRPVDPVAPIRFDFSEVVTATAQELDGSGPTPAAQLFWQQNGSSVWQPIPITMFLSRGGYSLVVQPPTGVTYQNDSLRRHVHLSRLRDATGNPMADYDKDFRIYDQNPPHVDVAFPAGAPTGQLVGGSSYMLTPSLSSLDDLPQGDVDFVEYFLASSGDASTPATTPTFTARALPYTWTFVAAYVGNGVDPRLFPVWVKATDTSANASNVVKLAMVVLPNAPPVVASVAAAATAPAAGTFYAGSSLAATVAGVADPDGVSVTLTAELRKNNAGSPNDPADLVASLPSQPLTRPAAGWPALPPPIFTATIPIATPDGTLLFFRVKATDVLGATATAESARFAVAHDPNAPVVDSLVARLSGASSPASQFFIGQKLVVEFRARDAETAVRATSLALSAVFTSPQAATLVGGTTDLYRTAELTVPATVPPGGQSVTATASATDWGGNTGTLPLTFTVSPTPDPYAPVATWLTPWEGGAWPSGYTSTVSGQGAALLLRVKVSDLDHVAGADVPGTIASVQFKGPADAAGTLAASFVDGSLVAGTGGPGTGVYETLWRVPNGVAAGTQLPFEVRVVDAGANVTIIDAHLRSVRPRKVYEAAQVAVLPADTMLGAGGDAAGPVFLLDGTVLSLYPQTSPAVRALPSMYVYAGGVAAGASFTPTASVLTAPEVTSYASSVLYNPLELTLTDTFGLGHGARVDMSAKGLLGSTPTQSMVLPGQTGSQVHAGGSHGGFGGPGSPGGWTRTDLTASGSVYDSAKDPSLPGAGGGYATGLYGATAPGGTGGGVVRLLAPGATLHLAGDILAVGGDGDGNYSSPGGAGGAIRLVAGRLEGSGGVSAGGGRGTSASTTGGGGGGSIALSFADPPEASIALALSAPGGGNAPVDANVSQIAGAGSIYLEETDAAGVPKAPGRLVVANGSGKPAWPTPFSGAQRFGAVEGHGAARLVFTDDLSVGAVDPPAVNDRTSVSLDAEARLLLKTEGPQIVLTATPDGGNVAVGQTLAITYSFFDPIGLAASTTTFSPQAPVVTGYDTEPVSITQGAQPIVLTVPGAQAPGPITYALTGADRAGRVATVQKTWTVLPDTTPPIVSVAGLVAGGVYHAGQTVSGTVTATDNGAVASVKVLVDGQTLTLSGAGPVYAFLYLVPRDLAAARDTTLQAVVTDAAGNPASTTPVALHFVLDAPPSLTLSNVTPGPTTSAGTTLQATATASDDVGLTGVTFALSGAVTTTDSRPASGLTFSQPFSYVLPANLTAGQTVTLTVTATDTFGHQTATSTTWTVAVDSQPPSIGAISISPVKAGDLYTAGDAVTFTVTATDNVALASIKLTINGQTTTFTASPAVLAWTAPGVGGSIPFTLAVEARDGAGNLATASKTITVQPLNNVGIPTAQFDCPTAGAVLPSGYAAFQMQVTGTDDVGVARIEFYRSDETTPFSVVNASPNATPFTAVSTASVLPTVTTPTVARYRARVYDASNNFAETVVDLTVVPTVDLPPSGPIDWASLTNAVAVLRSGTLSVDDPHTLGGLILLRGAKLTHSASAAGAEKSLNLTVNGPLYVECGGAIDVTSRGYPSGVSYPGVAAAGSQNGGSHIGQGGTYSGTLLGGTYGSVYRPSEEGGGASGSGGGVVRLAASAAAVIDGSILSTSSSYSAGGSVWITAASFGGSGTIDASAGALSSYAGGGGGAIALEYTSAAGSRLPATNAKGGFAYALVPSENGGAGTIWVKGPGATYGALTVANSGRLLQATILPSLGGGIAQTGSSGATLVTSLSVTPLPFFVGHWVEISSSTGTLKGTWRVASIAGTTLTLAPNASETISVQPGDMWQGLYRFDSTSLNGARLESADPIRVLGLSEIGSIVQLRRLDSTDLTIHSGGSLQHPPTPTAGPAESLTLNVSGILNFESNAAIDVSGLGYTRIKTYPGATVPSGVASGSHIGSGGGTGAGSTYGSVARPSEAGAGGDTLSGGGIVRIVSSAITFSDATGAIRANGASIANSNRGAGGSVWITTTSLSGDGAIEAHGGEATGGIGGGGGAVTIEYTSSTGTALSNATARGGNDSRVTSGYGGHGTVLRKGPASTFGALTASGPAVSFIPTILPSLGVGAAQAGTSGRTLVTDAPASFPPYFVGHWVQLTSAAGASKGVWQVGAVSDRTLTILPNLPDTTEPALLPGDSWQGAYRFDSVVLGGTLTSPDLVLAPGYSPPSGTIALAGGQPANVFPGATVNLTLTGADAQGVRSFVVRASGPVTPSSSVQSVSASGTSTTKSATVTLLSTATPGSTVTISGEVYDEVGTVTRIGSVTVTVVPDTTPPTISSVTFTPSSADGSYLANTALTIDVAATDDVGVNTVAMTVAGSTTTLSATPYRFTWTTPVVTGDTPYDLVFTARDYAGNTATTTRTVVVKKPSSGPVPTVSWNCPSGDTTVPAGATIQLSATGNAVNVAYIEFYRGDETTALYRGTPGTPTFPYSAAAATVLTTTPGPAKYRVRAFNTGFDFSEAVLNLTVVSAITIDPSAPNWTALATTPGVLPSGTLLVDTPRTVAGLFVLSGAKVTHSPSAVGVEKSLNLTINGPLFVECGGAIDVTAKGYPAGATYPGATAASSGRGGNHVGLAGGSGAGAFTYGSLETPAENGGGGASGGTAGGGVAKITVSGSTWIDGSVQANGGSGTAGLGGGGSIALSATSLAGAGVIQARGGDDANVPALTPVAACDPRPLACSATYYGALTPASCTQGQSTSPTDIFAFNGTSGTAVTITMQGAGYPYLYLISPSGQVVAETGTGNRQPYARLTFTLNVTGLWTIQATTNDAGPYGTYSLAMTSSCSGAAGGGGAVALTYQSALAAMISRVSARGGGLGSGAGAGSVVLKSPSSAYGDLVLDAVEPGPASSGIKTVLPALGTAAALAGTSGATVVTSAAPAAFSVGRWVEITSPVGTLKGTWRIASVSSNSFTLAPNITGDVISVSPGDTWQGVYRFDSIRAINGVVLASADPIRLGAGGSLVGPTLPGLVLEVDPSVSGSDVTIQGDVSATSISASSLTVKAGAVLSHPQIVSGATTGGLTLNVTGAVTVEAGGTIDVSGGGYAPGSTYPGESGAGTGNGGSHIGLGGIVSGTPASAFGSVYRPAQGGGSGGFNFDSYLSANVPGGAGGGLLRVSAGTLSLAAASSSIRANGIPTGRASGAGGSIWITAGSITGDGVIEARGGDGTYNSSGGGGAIAAEYAATSGQILSNLSVRTGASINSTVLNGGPGSIYLRGPAATYGDLVVDNLGQTQGQDSVLPSLGSGTALAGTSGATLVTDRSANIPAYFGGHWVEIRDASGTTLKGTWRIGSINAKTVTLVPNGGETISVLAGDKWQGVYRFDALRSANGGRVTSVDPIRIGTGSSATLSGPASGSGFLELPSGVVGDQVTVFGRVSTPSVTGTSLTVKGGSLLTVPATTSSTPQSLAISLTGTLTIESAASIDASGRGYLAWTTYNGATAPGNNSGGSHLGYGGPVVSPLGSTFGSVYRPVEYGGGGASGGATGGTGGGVVRVTAAAVAFADSTSVIRANGAAATTGSSGAGGSVWMTVTGAVAGPGVIEARGGDGAPTNFGNGGGGAIAIEYGSGTLAVTPLVRGGSSASNKNGGAGTIYARGPSSTYGDLSVSNVPTTGGQSTELPSLGSGIAQPGSGGATLVTDRSASVPPFFAGHWIEIRDATGTTLKGTWRISTATGGINDRTVTLIPNGAETINVVAGDLWQGVYRFDSLTYASGAAVSILSGDPVRLPAGAFESLTGPSAAGQYLELGFPISGIDFVVRGNVSLSSVTASSLTVKSGAILSHPATLISSASRGLVLALTGGLTIESGASVDVSGRGYPANVMYPGGGQGAHIGYGALGSGVYGSIYRPSEGGSGGYSLGLAGGGVVRIQASFVTFGDATSLIRASGADGSGSGGAGGSVWIMATGAVSGPGRIEARGSDGAASGNANGGGGAVAVEYGSASGTWTSNILARGGSSASGTKGGAGAIYLKGPASTYGDLTVSNVPTVGGLATELPSLGKGAAQAGSAGAVLVTDRSTSIPAYFAGHWIEIRTAAGALKGTWRISTAAGGISSKTVTLAPNGAETINVAAGDLWQGVYRFDSLTTPATVTVSILSNDPIRLGADGNFNTLSGPTTAGQFLELNSPVAGTDVNVTGNVSVTSITGTTLTVRTGAVLAHPATTNSSAPQSLTINVAGALTVENGASIDVSGRGYPAGSTYSGETAPSGSSLSSGGHHLGFGAQACVFPYSCTTGTVFGSIYRPGEAGGGANGGSAGGGVVRIVAGSLSLPGTTSAIRANGAERTGAGDGAGGSIWITTTGAVSGSGVMEARGGDNGYGGSGGAIAVEYASTGGSVLSSLFARGGNSGGSNVGGTGSVYLKGPSSTYGDLLWDNATFSGGTNGLPSLGSGTAQTGTTGATLVTNRSSNLQPYFVGNWVEVRSSGGALKGTWRIGAVNAKTLILVPNGAETISLAVGDLWQGVYRFDNITSQNGGTLSSADPIRLGGGGSSSIAGPTASGKFLELQAPITGSDVVLTGHVSTSLISASTMTVKSGAILTHPATTASAQSLSVTLTGALSLEIGAAIDASGRGYIPAATYPGATLGGVSSGGSHLGIGGPGTAPLASTFGSIYRPLENGGGGRSGTAGGGSIRIDAGSLSLTDATSVIRANGADATAAGLGAGGAIWISSAGAISGAGAIEARGGDGSTAGGNGGGGVIAIEYGSGTLAAATLVRGGASASAKNGGAGTVYTKGPSSTFGDLLIDNAGVAGGQATAPPILGSGTALTGTSGATLVTDRAVAIPAYFAGNWIEVRDSTGATLKGTWRISIAANGISNKTVILTPNGAETISIAVGDKWQGVYRFDNAPTVTGGASLASTDPIRIGGSLLRAEPVAAVSAPTPAPLALRSVSLCTDFAAPLKPGSSFVVCADTPARDVDLEISGAFEARIAGYGNCRDPIAIPGSARPGLLKIVATARDAEGRTASATARSAVVADELAPVLVSVEPAPAAVFRSGDPLRVAVETWDDVGIASVAITLGGTRTILTAPPFEVRTLAPPVASGESLAVLVEVFDPSGNVSRRAFDLGVLPAGARLPAVSAVPAPGVSFEDGRLAVDGGWPWRDADGETRGRTLELPAIGAHAVLGADGAAVALDSPVARAAVHGGSVDVRRGGELVARFRILSVSEDGLVLRLEGGADGNVRTGDFLEGVWSFDELLLTHGARLIAGDVVEARSLHVDASSLFHSRNLQIPSPSSAPVECPTHGARPDPPGTAPASAGDVTP
jgi:hypothetical protein